MSAHLTLPDYHTHTELCKHAKGMPADYRAAAAEAGLRQLATTDHCPTDDGFGIDHRMALDQFTRYRASVEAAADGAGPGLLFGVEADYYRGCERFLGKFLAAQPFDLVLGSVHFLDYWSSDPASRGLSRNADASFVWREYFLRIAELARSGLYDIVTHLDLPKKFGNELPPGALREFALPALDRIAKAGMAIEINTSGLNHPPRACYPSPELLAWAAEREIGLVFGSDAHTPERVGAGFDQALELARAADFTKYREYRERSFVSHPLPT